MLQKHWLCSKTCHSFNFWQLLFTIIVHKGTALDNQRTNNTSHEYILTHAMTHFFPEKNMATGSRHWYLTTSRDEQAKSVLKNWWITLHCTWLCALQIFNCGETLPHDDLTTLCTHLTWWSVYCLKTDIWAFKYREHESRNIYDEPK